MRKFLLNATLLASALAANAAAPYPGTVTYTQPDGTPLQVTIEGNEHGQIYRLASTGEAMLADADGTLRAASSAQISEVKKTIEQAEAKAMASRGTGLHTAYVGHWGSPKVCVILVEFKDVKFNVSDPKTYFTNWLNQENYTTDGNSGSVRDYFKAQSAGQFTPQFDVYGPVTLSNNRSSYASSSNGYKMVHDGCGALDSQVDFSQYDLDGDGNVDNVYVIYAGQGANYGASNAPWAHNSECPTNIFTRKSVDGKMLVHYSCCSEEGYTVGQPDGIGTFIHEFGHALGFPDFYNTNSQGIETPYFWSIMDRGNYLGYGKTPIGFSAYERAAMDWLTYTDLKDEAAHVNLRPLAEYNYALKIETGRLGDYYILENRPATGFDKAIYGEGMLIWHIDASNYSELINSPNNTSSHLRMDLVRADNNKSTDSFWGDAFPGSTNNTSFTATSTPQMYRWDYDTGSSKTAVDKPLTNITKLSSYVSFDYMGGSETNIIDPEVTPSRLVSVTATEGGSAYVGSDANTTSVSAELGSQVTLHAVPASGYVFDKWTRNGSVVGVSSAKDYTFTLTEANAGAYTANFTAVSADALTIEVVATTGGTACINGDNAVTSLTADAGKRVLITALPQSGYTFTGWYFNDTFFTSYTSAEVVLSASTAGTYTAKFAPDTRSNYAHVDANSTYTGSTRGVQTLTVSDNAGNELTVDGPGNANGHPVYVDRTEQVLTVQPGATLAFTGTAVNTEWMHSYIYIDFNNNRRFDVDVNNTDVNGDLVSHTGYNLEMKSNNSDTADPTVKSDGSTVNHGNYFEIPVVVLPDDMAEGTYRLRYKNDWNNSDPYGRTEYSLTGGQVANYIFTNGGSIIDLTLRVVALSGIEGIEADGSDAPVEYFNLMGLPVAADNLTPGIYIVRRGNTVSKTYVR